MEYDMRHKWDYSQYGNEPRDMLCKGKRVCLVCGEVHRRFDEQVWMRVAGYHWDGDGRSPCPGPPEKAKKKG
jgi:hypothetical protein